MLNGPVTGKDPLEKNRVLLQRFSGKGCRMNSREIIRLRASVPSHAQEELLVMQVGPIAHREAQKKISATDPVLVLNLVRN